MESCSVKYRLIMYLKYKRVSKTEFGNTIGVSNAYISAIRKSIQPDKIQSISLNYPDLNIDWLMTGEGDMLKSTISQDVNGDRNTAVAGNGNHVNDSKLIEEIAAQRRITEKSQEQIDRLLSIIEKMNK